MMKDEEEEEKKKIDKEEGRREGKGGREMELFTCTELINVLVELGM